MTSYEQPSRPHLTAKELAGIAQIAMADERLLSIDAERRSFSPGTTVLFLSGGSLHSPRFSADPEKLDAAIDRTQVMLSQILAGEL